MTRKSNDKGRAYEYICLHVLYEAISAVRKSEIIHNSSYNAAECAWNMLSVAEKSLFTLSAKSTIDTLFALEPNIVEASNDTLHIYLQSDRHGEEADVRDIIIDRKDIIWEIGLSLKHNHTAVKHSRLAKSLDFGKKWYGVNCSEQYWQAVKPIFDFLEAEKAKGTCFRDLSSKEEDVYMPLLHAFMQEVKMQIQRDSGIPRKLIEYLLSKYDFYKVISIDNKRITTIQSFNMYGTLNQSSKTQNPSLEAPLIELPTTLLYMDFKSKSKTTVIMGLDNGWQFSFRLHNAKDKVEPSLKFDVQIVGMPPIVNLTYNCKW